MNTITKAAPVTEAIIHDKLRALKLDIKASVEDKGNFFLSKVHVLGSIVHNQMVALMELGVVELNRSGSGITFKIVTVKE